MKIQNLTQDSRYFGYEASGFTLKANEISREMAPAMAANSYLRMDVSKGIIRLLCDATDNNNLRAMGLTLPTFVKPSAAPVVKAAVVPKETVNMMMVELENYINGMRSLPEKVKYLEELIAKGKPQAKGIAESLLVPLKAQLVNDTSSHPKDPEPSKQVIEEPAAEIKSTEPMINMGTKDMPKESGMHTALDEKGVEGVAGVADPVKRVARTKAIAQMSKLELLSYGTTLGCDINPMTPHKDIKEKVAAKEKELGYEFKK